MRYATFLALLLLAWMAAPTGPAYGQAGNDSTTAQPASAAAADAEFVRGSVLLPDGKPCVGAAVTVEILKAGNGLSFDRLRRLESVTDENGFFKIAVRELLADAGTHFQVEAGTANLVASKSRLIGSQALKQAMRFPDVRLRAGIAISGRLLNPQGLPASRVFLFPSAFIPAEGAWFPRSIAVGEDGRFRCVLPEGDRVQNVPTEFIALSKDAAPLRISVPSGSQRDLGDLSLPAGSILEGRLLDHQGEPVAEALIAAQGADYGRLPNQAYQWTMATRTNESGDFRFPSPIAEPVRLWCPEKADAHVDGAIKTVQSGRSDIFVLPQLIKLGPGEAPRIVKCDLQAAPPVSIRGTVRFADGKGAPGIAITPIYSVGQTGAALPIPSKLTDKNGRYEFRAPKGLTGFGLMVSGTRRGAARRGDSLRTCRDGGFARPGPNWAIESRPSRSSPFRCRLGVSSGELPGGQTHRSPWRSRAPRFGREVPRECG